MEWPPSEMKSHGKCQPLGSVASGQPYCLMAKPNSRKTMMPTPMWPVIFIITLATSRERTCPPSSRKNPACIRKIKLPMESSHSQYTFVSTDSPPIRFHDAHGWNNAVAVPASWSGGRVETQFKLFIGGI